VRRAIGVAIRLLALLQRTNNSSGYEIRPHPPRLHCRPCRDRRLTSLPAQQIGIKGRGRLAAGYAADVVVFDSAKIAGTATYDKPHSYAVGVSDVLVNGVAVLRGGEHTDARPARFVKGPGWRRG
jgi:cytosine/adenosine deaminase-related metal-dependent hydrolase